MSFGPPWPLHLHEAPASGDVLTIVRRAAERLVEDLQAAARATGNWGNATLADQLIEAAFSRCLAAMAVTGLWGPDNQVPSSELWRVAGPVLHVGWLQHRARFKPLGYAGDFEMLRRICRGVACEDPLGAAFDRYFLAQAAPQAVRARAQQTAATLSAELLRRRSGEFRFTSVGSGPAIDLADCMAALPPRLAVRPHATLLDIDPDAVEYATQQVAPLRSDWTIDAERVNLFRLAASAKMSARLGTPDLLVCSGLFDYLDPQAAAKMLGCFWERLAPGGLVLVGNFSPHNPTRAYMEWVGNWYLTYRTTAEMQQLALEAGIPANRFTITSERLGVDLFLAARK